MKTKAQAVAFLWACWNQACENMALDFIMLDPNFIEDAIKRFDRFWPEDRMFTHEELMRAFMTTVLLQTANYRNKGVP